MAMRAPVEDKQVPIPEDDPVWVAIRNAPIVEGEPSEEELQALREWEEQGSPWVDGAVVSAEVAERVRRQE